MPAQSDKQSPPASPLRGRLFGHGNGGEGCTIEVRAGALVAEVDSGGSHELRLDSAALSYGGTNGDMLVVVTPEGTRRLSLYLPRAAGLATLRRLGSVWLDRQLDQLSAGAASTRRRHLMFAAGLLAVIGVALVVAYLAIDRVVAWGVGKVPVTWEVKLGKALMDRLHEPSSRIETTAIRAQIDPIVARLLAAVPPSGYEFEVHIVADESVNAFALPGGQIAVHTALLAKCRTPDELAGVLAHEIQHVLHRHSLYRFAFALKWNLALSLVLGDLGSVSQVLLAQSADLLSLSNSREDEREADRSGVGLLYDARVDPHGMAGFFEGMNEGKPEMGVASYLSTHPADAERVRTIQRLVAERNPVAAIPFDVDWDELKSALTTASKERGQ